MLWTQKLITLPSYKRGCHLVTSEIVKQLPELKQYKLGLAHIFIQHTSASLTVNENCDSDVRRDMEDVLNRLVPENSNYRHDAEGSDDMPAHMKASIFGSSVTIPITNGTFNLGVLRVH